MFYLMMHILFMVNWCWTYGKEPRNSQRKNTLLPLHMLLFSVSSKGSFIYIIPDRIAHTMAFGIPVLKNWLVGLAQWVHTKTHCSISGRSTMVKTHCFGDLHINKLNMLICYENNFLNISMRTIHYI